MLALLRSLASGRLDPPARLLLGQLVMFMGIAAVFPVAPLYVKSHGGGFIAVAIFIAGPMIANTLVQVPAGYLVDWIGRKPVLIGSRLIFVLLAFGLFLNIGPLWFLALLRAGQGATGGAYVPALRAALADLTPVERRGERYAQLQAIEMVGLLVGPLLGGAVALWQYSAIFLCSGLGSLIGVSALINLPETRGLGVYQSEVAGPVSSGWWRTRAVLVPCFGLFAMGVMFATYDVVWPQYLATRGNGPFVIGLSISLFAVPILLLATRAGRFSDRGNRRVLIVGAFLIVASCAMLYPELHSLPVILLVGVVEACGFMLVEPTLFAVMSESTTAEIRGRAMGFGGLFQFGGGALGASILGALFGLNAGVPFWSGAAICVAASAVCGLWLPVRRFRHVETPEALPQIMAVDMEAQV